MATTSTNGVVYNSTNLGPGLFYPFDSAVNQAAGEKEYTNLTVTDTLVVNTPPLEGEEDIVLGTIITEDGVTTGDVACDTGTIATAPVGVTDIANKAYVDDKIGLIPIWSDQPLYKADDVVFNTVLATGGTSTFDAINVTNFDTGDIQTLSGSISDAPTAANHIANKSYVDSAIAASGGGTFEAASFLLDGALTVTSNTATVLPWNTTDWNAAPAVFTLASNVVTVTKAGYYLVNTQIHVQELGSLTGFGGRATWIVLNGGTAATDRQYAKLCVHRTRLGAVSKYQTWLNASDVIKLAANDTLTVYFEYNELGTSLQVSKDLASEASRVNKFTITRVGDIA